MTPVSLASSEVIYALDFSSWKRSVVRRCFPDRKVVFVDNVSGVADNGMLAVWGMRPVAQGSTKNVKALRIEDGFLRSVGLGADLIKPMSWVVDSRGIYYDATRPSDLEYLLANSSFEPAAVQRATFLRERIVAAGLTKYNVGVLGWRRPDQPEQVILVPGQVESDDSLAYGAPGVQSNIELLRAVREANPRAYVVYKPHPDVMAGLRAAGLREADALDWCDELVADVAMEELLNVVDEVHVLTSLAGFEALLRGKPVTCYGQPFYAGWGLTKDVVPIPRRKRRLLLDELVAGALVEYPVYFSRVGDAVITPEQALDELSAWRARVGEELPWWRTVKRMILRRVVGVR